MIPVRNMDGNALKVIADDTMNLSERRSTADVRTTIDCVVVVVPAIVVVVPAIAVVVPAIAVVVSAIVVVVTAIAVVVPAIAVVVSAIMVVVPAIAVVAPAIAVVVPAIVVVFIVDVVIDAAKVALQVLTHVAQPVVALAPAKWSITHRMPGMHSRTQAGELASLLHAFLAFTTFLPSVLTG